MTSIVTTDKSSFKYNNNVLGYDNAFIPPPYIQNFCIGGSSGYIEDIKIQPWNNKTIFVQGYSQYSQYNNLPTNGAFRLNSNGSLDTTFDIGTGFAPYGPYKFTIQPNRKIIFVGTFTSYSGIPVNHVVRINEFGKIDSTFGNGFSVSPFNVYITPDNKILFCGTNINYNGLTPNAGIVILNLDGSLYKYIDKFGGDSTVTAVAFDSNNNIYAAGRFNLYNSNPAGNIIKINYDGVVDTTFNCGNGINDVNNYPSVIDITICQNGDLIIGGVFNQYNGNFIDCIVRIDSTGQFVPFNVRSTIYNSNNYPRVYRIIELSDNKILVGGSFTVYDGNPVGHIVRLNVDGSYDNTFNQGIGFEPRNISVDPVSTIEQTPTGFFVGGTFTKYNGYSAQELVVLNTDGGIFTCTGSTPTTIKTIQFCDNNQVYNIDFGNWYPYITNGKSYNNDFNLNNLEIFGCYNVIGDYYGGIIDGNLLSSITRQYNNCTDCTGNTNPSIVGPEVNIASIAFDGGIKPCQNQLVTVTLDAIVPSGSTAVNALWYNYDYNIVSLTGLSASTQIIFTGDTTAFLVRGIDINGNLGSIKYTNITANPVPFEPPYTYSDRCGFGPPLLKFFDASYQYYWYDSPSGGTLLNTGYTFDTIITGDTDYYIEYVEDLHNCVGDHRIHITQVVYAPPDINVDISLSSPYSACTNTIYTLEETLHNYDIYEWSASPIRGSGLESGSTDPSINVRPTLSGTYTYTLNTRTQSLNSTTGDCRNSTSIVVEVLDGPNINDFIYSAIVTPNEACNTYQNIHVELFADGPAPQFKWTLPYYGNIVDVYTNPGERYINDFWTTLGGEVRLTIPQGYFNTPNQGCTTSVPLDTITIHPLPLAPSGSNGSPQCGYGIPTVSVSSNSGLLNPVFIWRWNIDNYTSIIQSGTSNTFLSPISSSISFLVTEISEFGCESNGIYLTPTVTNTDYFYLSTLPYGQSTYEISNNPVSFNFTISQYYLSNQFDTITIQSSPEIGSGVTGVTQMTPILPTNGGTYNTIIEPFPITITEIGTYTYTAFTYDNRNGCVGYTTQTINVVTPPSYLIKINTGIVDPNLESNININVSPNYGSLAKIFDLSVGDGTIINNSLFDDNFTISYTGSSTQIITFKTLNAGQIYIGSPINNSNLEIVDFVTENNKLLTSIYSFGSIPFVSGLTINGCTSLGSFQMFDQRFKVINAKGCTSLNESSGLYTQTTYLEYLDVRNTGFYYLYAGYGNLSTLLISGCTNLNGLAAGTAFAGTTNKLKSVDFTGCNGLIFGGIDLANNDLTSSGIDTILTTLYTGTTSYYAGIYLYPQQNLICYNPSPAGYNAYTGLTNDRGYYIDVTFCPPAPACDFTYEITDLVTLGIVFGGYDSRGSGFIFNVSGNTNFSGYITYANGVDNFSGSNLYSIPHSWDDDTSWSVNVYMSDTNAQSVTYLNLSGLYIRDIVGLNNLPNLTYLYLQGNGLIGSQINNILNTFSGTSVNNGYIDLTSQYVLSCPSGDGIISKDHLVNDLGWTVLADDTCTPPPVFNLTYNSTGNTKVYLLIEPQFWSDMLIDWGDGSEIIKSYVQPYVTLEHTYINSGDFIASVTGTTDISAISVTDSRLKGITGITSLPYLNMLVLNGNLISDISQIELPTTLKILTLERNQLTSFNPSGVYNLEVIGLSLNQITSFNITPWLDVLTFPSNSGTIFIELAANYLSSTELSNFLINIDNLTWFNGGLKKIELELQVGGGCIINPSSGYDAYQSLISKGFLFLDYSNSLICP